MPLWLRAALTTLLEVCGLGAVVVGTYLLAVPAAWIVGGLCALLLSWRLTDARPPRAG